MSLSIGVVAGVGSIAFMLAIKWATHVFLGLGAGFSPPLPTGEGEPVAGEILRRWMFPVVGTLGGLLVGLLIYKLAPEAEGHGTDAAIEAFHHKQGHIRSRVPLLKLVASAITIGSGGSAGREGPTAQIAAGFGSLMGRVFNLSVHQRSIALAVGIGAGIGSIFKSPLGGAVLSVEVLYLQGFEVEALIPSLIASLVGYAIFATWSGFSPIFGEQVVTFNDPVSLIYYAGLGIACGVVAILYSRSFYAVRNLFRRLAISNYFKPALGGLVVGLLGMVLPQVLGMGYGWLQLAMRPDGLGLPALMLIALVFAKILATAFAIGSGGSGGVFAPGLFIGGMVGAAAWSLLSGGFPHMPPGPQPFIVVGMMALFGAVAHAPLAVMLMVAEMTGSYALLAPAMVAVGLASAIVGRNTIYESQLASPALSPLHRAEHSVPLLHLITVQEAMTKNFAVTSPTTTLTHAYHLTRQNPHSVIMVGDPSANKGIQGIVAPEDLMRIPPERWDSTSVAQVMTKNVVSIQPHDTLNIALAAMTRHNISSLPVIEKKNGQQVVGLLLRHDIAHAYAEALRSRSSTDSTPDTNDAYDPWRGIMP